LVHDEQTAAAAAAAATIAGLVAIAMLLDSNPYSAKP